MTYYSVSALFNFAIGLSLGIFVLYKNYKLKINQSLFFWCFAVAFWSFFYFLWQIENDKGTALIWTRILMLGAVWIPVAYLRVVLIFLNVEKKYKFLLYANYFLSVLFSLLLLTPLMVSHVEPVAGFPFWPKPGLAFAPFLMMFLGVSGYSAYLSYKSLKTEPSAVKRAQIKYMLLGMAISIVCGSSNYFLWYNIPIKPYGNLFASTYVVFTAYAILRYRLMDMRVIARTFLIYVADAAYAYVFYSLLIIVYPILWGSVYSKYAMLAGIVVTPVFVLVFFNFDRLVKYFLDRYFFYSLYDYQRTITQLSAELNKYTDLTKIIDLIVDTIKNTMGLNRAGVLLIDKTEKEINYKIAKVTGFDITNGISLIKDSFLTKYLKQIAKPLVREELAMIAGDARTSKESQSFLNLEKEMAHIKASLCLPLLSGRELLGIIVLGAKNSGDPFTQEDLNLLATLSNQAAVAIDNARLYQEAKNFNKVMQTKVDEQTKELKARAEHLEKLLKMREEFLDIASHQLKTPVSVIRGTISMFRDGSMDKLPKEQQQKFMDNIYHKTEKLNLIISDILRASEIDSDEFKIYPENSQTVRLEDILNSIHDDLKELAADKGIALEFNLPAKAAPKILTSADFLEQALYNLVDNAIKYTAKGSVKVDLSSADGQVAIKVSDTGIGIPAADQKKMFDKFSRAKNAIDMYADGTGLGLFIVKRIIEAHPGGKITFDSAENKGTTFTVVLPAIKK